MCDFVKRGRKECVVYEEERGKKGVQGAPISEGTSKKEEELGDLLFEGIHFGNDGMWLLSLGFSFRMSGYLEVGFRLVRYIGLRVQTYICSRKSAYFFMRASAVYDHVSLDAFTPFA